MNRNRWSRWLAAIAALTATAVQAGETFTYEALCRRLTDLEAPAVLPAAGETCRLWSSYDRASRYDEKTGKYLDWSANNDANGIIRKEGNLQVFAEMDGPGVIWRIWAASPGDGHVKILLDGAETPAVDLPFKQYFDGSQAPFQGRALCHITAWGRNCYVPIPFRKSCRIVAEEGWGQYYQFTCAMYPKGTVLPTFTRNLTDAGTQALARADAILYSKRGQDPAGERPGSVVEEKTLTLAPGTTVTAADLKGRRAITALKVSMDVPSRNSDILREICLRITWDGEREPAVWSPLGDFFGSAPGVNLYRSLPMGMTADGFYSYWYMPFAERARIELTNDGKEPRTVRFTVSHAPLTRPVKSLGRFHAKWHRNAFPPEHPDRASIDWTLLKTRGRGRFLGVMLNVWCPQGGGWWEGDEKFFVDGEKFPSSFGTGTEDYFGYAWVRPELFENAYHNQTRNDNNNNGHISVNRWQVADNVPFRTGFEAVIEKYAGDESALYAATAYWYQQAGQADAYQELPLDERAAWRPPTAVSAVVNGREISLVLREKTRGELKRQDMSSYGAGWRGADQAWWTGTGPGDRLVLDLPVKEAGKFRLGLNLTRSWDYGIVQVTLDGKKVGEPQDLFSSKVEPLGVDLGIQELAAGAHQIGFEIVGCNENAGGAKYMAGIDSVTLAPVNNAGE